MESKADEHDADNAEKFRDEIRRATPMKQLAIILVIAFFFGSPIWTTALIAWVPRRRIALAWGICSLQVLLAYTIWWFFWGGGIGGEARLAKSWQLALGFALLPVGFIAFRFWWFSRKHKTAH